LKHFFSAVGVNTKFIVFFFYKKTVFIPYSFSPALIALARSMRMSQNLAGVTLLAFGNGAPDVFSAITAITTGDPEAPDEGLGLGFLMGDGAMSEYALNVMLTIVLIIVIIITLLMMTIVMVISAIIVVASYDDNFVVVGWQIVLSKAMDFKKTIRSLRIMHVQLVRITQVSDGDSGSSHTGLPLRAMNLRVNVQIHPIKNNKVCKLASEGQLAFLVGRSNLHTLIFFSFEIFSVEPHIKVRFLLNSGGYNQG
uniref:Na_Ca_ex domain-containing protein n=1 Tax=Schistocephalus solidus TaxID=70667 RepID=A0A183TIU1_SCHSO